GTRKSIEMLVRALQIEQDGATGRSMGAALKLATAPEAVQAVERAIAGPRKPGDFFAAVWALSGVAVGASEPGDAALQSLLKKGHNSEVSLRACALEAIGDSGRPELVEWLLPTLREATPAIDKANVFETLSLL